MSINIETAAASEVDAAVLVLLLAQDAAAPFDGALGQSIDALLALGDFEGKSGQLSMLYPGEGLTAKRLMLVGLGAAAEITSEAVRRAAGAAIRKARELKLTSAAFWVGDAPLDAAALTQAVTEGALLANYLYTGQKTEDDSRTVETISVLATSQNVEAVRAGVAMGEAFAAGTMTARDLVNLPPNLCTPIYLASRARNLAQASGMQVEVLEKAQMEALRMGALLAVAQGSDTPPRFIILEHNPQLAGEGRTIVLVGKGVTFDTGGYSIKSSDGMVGMKADMAGAAAVIGAMQTVAALNVPRHVVGLVPAADNMISGHAYRPEEVITASNDKTIEIISTDAEGRLLLADALVYASRYKPAAVVDIATLTGSCIIALGHVAAGVFVTDDTLRDTLVAAGLETNEKVWPMPLYKEYRKYLESTTADMKNTGGRDNGVGTAAVFLQEFTDYPAWAHIDMAGFLSNVPESPYVPPKGANGYGARLLAEYVRRAAAD